MSFFRRPFSRRAPATEPELRAGEGGEFSDGSLEYVAEKAGNESGVSYQEASGAPVESRSPMGYQANSLFLIFLNIGKMIGTGVFSTPSTILSGTGSVGLSMVYWGLGFVTSATSLSIYLEYMAYFPNRSGSEVVYLEQAYPRPRYFFPTTFAFQSVVLSFSSGNAIVLANYLFRINGHSPTAWELKGVAIAGFTVATLLVALHTKFSFRLTVGIGIVKVLTLIFISITGWVVLSGKTSVPDPYANFVNSFEGKATPYGLTNSLVKIVFSYAGYENAFNLVNEVRKPVKTIRNSAYISLGIVTALYIFTNISYFAAVPKAELKAASQISASLFFTKVFGSSNAVKGLNFLIALSAFGNLVTVLIGTSRMIRECGRQGVLPWPRFWATTRPLGTPLGPYFVKWILTVLMILAPPAGDAFNFIVDLQSYPSSAFQLAMAVGLYVVRWRRKRIGLPRPSYRAWDASVVFAILVNLFLLIMPWYPPDGGIYAGDVSFWYASYVVTGIAIIAGCGIYYALWIYVVPKFRGYKIRQVVIALENGEQSHKIVQVPNAELAHWDATHDAVGRGIGSTPCERSSDPETTEEKV
ncbi:putative High-affinity methionine permease [Seiridium cardinale]|uniref:High-affinity methionine permease n=1 Tax=Seiridium cardinale TaxID=138064 RepID=A0ABR2X8K3_9PEZI